MKKKLYPNWTRIQWDGNPALNLECWRKSFRRGHVSIGIGTFNLIAYSYGPNSDESISGTRWRKAGPISEVEAMAQVDAANGYYLPPYPLD